MQGGKRSQVTIFIIVSILVLVMVIIGLIMYNRFASGRSEISRDKIIEVDVSYVQFNSYIETCLDNALNDALYFIGRQGGFIFMDQAGSIIDFEIQKAKYIDNYGKDFDIAFINDDRLSPLIANEPIYPCFGNYSSAQFSNYSLDKVPLNLIGENCFINYYHDMPNISMLFNPIYQKIDDHPVADLDIPLCSKDLNITHNLGGTTAPSQAVCKASGNAIKNKYAIQNQTEMYIKFRLEKCFQEAKSYITDQIDAEAELQGDVEVDVIFGDVYTSAILTFPLVLSFPNVDSRIKSFKFHAKTDVRFKTIYALLYGNNLLLRNPYTGVLSYFNEGIIDKDLVNLSFDVETDSPGFLSNKDIHNISIYRLYDGEGSIIKVVDHLSDMRGKPYEYYVRMRNRAPALNFIPGYPPNRLDKDYDIYVYENSSLILAPEAHDLDDEGKEGNGLRFLFEIEDAEWKWRNESLYNNDLYELGYDNQLGLQCNNAKYGTTKSQCARILLNSSDLGNHILKIVAMDHNGLYDSQTLKIFVDSNSNLTFRIENIYDDIGSSYTIGSVPRYIVSNEDPFILNASGSLFPIGPYINELMWEDMNNGVLDIDDEGYHNFEPFTSEQKYEFKNIYPFYYNARDTMIVHPGYDNYTDYSILEDFMKRTDQYNNNLGSNDNVINVLTNVIDPYLYIFNITKREGYPFNVSTQMSSIKLSSFKQRLPMLEVENPIFISKCLPHRDDAPIFPFNLIRTLNDTRNINPYFANHTCCFGDSSLPLSWSLAPEEYECYSSEEIGTYEDFVINLNTNISSELFLILHPEFANNMDYLVPIIVDQNDPNVDLYVRSIRGECDGKRGNICIPKNFSIQKFPYCGSAGFNNNDKMIKDTIVPVIPQGGYYDKLCVAKEDGVPRIMNMTNTSLDPIYNVPHNEIYSCFNAQGIPERLSDKPCTIQHCLKADVTDTFGPNYNKPISNTVFSIYPGPYCKCGFNSTGGDVIVDSSNPTYSNYYCCNPGQANDYELNGDYNDCIAGTVSGTGGGTVVTPPPIDTCDALCQYNFVSSNIGDCRAIILSTAKTCWYSYNQVNPDPFNPSNQCTTASGNPTATCCCSISPTTYYNDKLNELETFCINNMDSDEQEDDRICRTLGYNSESHCFGDNECKKAYKMFSAYRYGDPSKCQSPLSGSELDFCKVISNSSSRHNYIANICTDVVAGTCAACAGNVSTLTLKYNGAFNAQIKVIQYNNDVLFDNIVNAHGEFSLVGTDNGNFGNKIFIYINSVLDTEIVTKCNDPIPRPGLVRGHFTVISGTSVNGGDLCPLPICVNTLVSDCAGISNTYYGELCKGVLDGSSSYCNSLFSSDDRTDCRDDYYYYRAMKSGSKSTCDSISYTEYILQCRAAVSQQTSYCDQYCENYAFGKLSAFKDDQNLCNYIKYNNDLKNQCTNRLIGWP